MKTVYETILSQMDNGIYLNELLSKTELDIKVLTTKINYLKQKGYAIEKEIGINGIGLKLLKKRKPVTNLQIYAKRPFKFLLIADTHFGHVNDNLEFAIYTQKYAIKRKIKHIIHLGDSIQGILTENQVNSLKYDSLERQLSFMINKYPQDAKIANIMLLGNHEDKLFRELGLDYATLINNRRLDILHLGKNSNIIEINNRNILLSHPYRMTENLQIEDNGIINEFKNTNIDAIFKGHHHKSRFYFSNGIFASTLPSLYPSSNKEAPGAYEVEFIPGDKQGTIDAMVVKPLVLTPEIFPITEICHEFEKREPRVFNDIQKTYTRIDKFNQKYDINN